MNGDIDCLIQKLFAHLGEQKSITLTAPNGELLTILRDSIIKPSSVNPDTREESFLSEKEPERIVLDQKQEEKKEFCDIALYNSIEDEQKNCLSFKSIELKNISHHNFEGFPLEDSFTLEEAETPSQPESDGLQDILSCLQTKPLESIDFAIENKTDKIFNNMANFHSESLLPCPSNTFDEFLDENKMQIKKKISLNYNKKTKSNEVVLNFMEEISKTEEKLIFEAKEEEKKIVSSALKLAEYTPEIKLFEEKLIQLESVSKVKQMLEEEISSIIELSKTSLLSDDIDGKSLTRLSLITREKDPLCQLFAKYLKPGLTREESEGSASFLFFYSQPMLDEKGKPVEDMIDYFEEESIIRQTLKDKNCKVNYVRERASVDRLHYWINQGIEIIHFCGHGVKSFPANYLIFENMIGESIKVGYEQLEHALEKSKLKLVFIASCYSESIGKIFLAAGALHVVCILNDFPILDEACKEFVQIFYESCTTLTMTVCEAFAFARRQLQLCGKFSQHECEKFKLLKEHTQCIVQFELKGKAFADLTSKPYYNRSLPSRVENFVGRNREMHDLLKLLQEKRRFLTIMGTAGVGKSTLVREFVRHVQFRGYFKDGVVYLELRNCSSVKKLFEMLDMELFEKTTMRKTKSFHSSVNDVLNELSEKSVLIVLDNCQFLTSSEESHLFKELITEILKHCPHTHCVFTNRNSLTYQLDYCLEALYELKNLEEVHAQRLFMLRVPRKITDEEIYEFCKDHKVSRLVKHPLFQFFDGHPEAICLTASLLSERTFPELYDLLLQPGSRLTSELEGRSGREPMSQVVETAMKISLNVMRNKHNEASEMIKMLSLLPSGLDSELMSKIFGNTWKAVVQKLVSHNLVLIYERAGTKYYAAHPHLIVHIQEDIRLEEQIQFQEKICIGIYKRMEKLYKNVGTFSQHSARAQEMFLIEQENYKAIILRELCFLGDRRGIQELYCHLFQENNIIETKSRRRYSISEEALTIEAPKRTSHLEKIISKKEPLETIIIHYLTILFVLHRSNRPLLEEFISYGLIISQKKGKVLLAANVNRIRGCMMLAESKMTEAKKYFTNAWVDFAYEGCGLGAASCEAAVGYIRLIEDEHASAKMNLESALKYYDELQHGFGKHYLNRWLLGLKSKINRGEQELSSHKVEAQKLLKEAKLSLKENNIKNVVCIGHKVGVFVFRFALDNISLFLEASFEVDIRPKVINITQGKKNEEKNEKNEEMNILEEIEEEEKEEKKYFENSKKELIKIKKPFGGTKSQKIEKMIEEEEIGEELLENKKQSTAKNTLKKQENGFLKAAKKKNYLPFN